MSDRFRIDGRRALVTGANTGIGRAIAESLAERGAHVVAAGRSSCAETVAAIEAAGGRAEAMTLDLSDPVAAAARLAEAGPLDILVNNAGIIRREDSVDYTEADWDDVMDVNLKAVFLLSQAFAKAAIARGTGGTIVNIASLLSFQGGIRVPGYTASKHGVAGLTKVLANEWAGQGITVNAVAPGYIATNNTEALRNDPKRSAEILGRIPAGRWGDPEDIGGAVAFLCTAAAGYVTGAILNVDGGWLAR
ncbi:2-dehydro-3-deoxy-D-gluconate 5-dehydrogenase KduD [Histidinibacterium aquaticum]|uniref:2-dehydro-3-deoxy-D-gluconate 5-dehydrogenase KduD n=1 Tax=Histidinibacterium aquaticum TaxID=2613962 RepID=A0A5J5GMN1_9RHOB|nr:2-dehydro-3-deoxy-D-gluconate 5-dehydrogenase KduD [Histidinibacterium aquaticum]KAA9009400.1 2-dehydro-3-deoxy-D-gluconate 5-dehydrogenase KduD [Histidinibacterium aquaticum]